MATLPAAGRPATSRLLDSLRTVSRALRPLAHEVAGGAAGRADVQMLHVLTRLGATRGGDLAAALCVDPSVVSRQVAGLAAQGLVERRPDPADARATLVTVSDAGVSRLDQWRESAESLLHQRLAGWSDDDLSAAAAVLQRLATDLTATTTPRGHR